MDGMEFGPGNLVVIWCWLGGKIMTFTVMLWEGLAIKVCSAMYLCKERSVQLLARATFE